jgi:hypothetical protein
MTAMLAAQAPPRNTDVATFIRPISTLFLDLNYSKLQAIFPRAAHSVD